MPLKGGGFGEVSRAGTDSRVERVTAWEGEVLGSADGVPVLVGPKSPTRSLLLLPSQLPLELIDSLGQIITTWLMRGPVTSRFSGWNSQGEGS